MILGVALWLRHDSQTSSLLVLQFEGHQAPGTFYISEYPPSTVELHYHTTVSFIEQVFPHTELRYICIISLSLIIVQVNKIVLQLCGFISRFSLNFVIISFNSLKFGTAVNTPHLVLPRFEHNSHILQDNTINYDNATYYAFKNYHKCVSTKLDLALQSPQK